MPASTCEGTVARIQAVLDSCVARGVPGISAAVRTAAGEEHYFQAGYSNIAAEKPLYESAAFGIGSITKVFVAVVILQLVEEQRLTLDDRVSALLPSSRFLDSDPHAANARISNLLSHTSGIASWEDDLEWIQAGRGRNIQPAKIWRKDETLPYVKSSASAALKPGTFSYANTNYTLLGLIIEHITEQTAESEIRRRVLQPLGMQDTYVEGFESPTRGEDQTPHRYHWATSTFCETAGISPHISLVSGREDLVDVSDSNLSVSWMAGGMISTPSDLLKFAAALQRPSSTEHAGLLTLASLSTLMDWHPVDEKQKMGHGIFRSGPATGGSWVGHNGGVLGFSAAWWWAVDAEDRATGCATSILCNVGTSHSCVTSPSAVHDPTRLEILRLAAEL